LDIWKIPFGGKRVPCPLLGALRILVLEVPVPWILCVGKTFNSKETHNNQNIGLSAKGSGSKNLQNFVFLLLKEAAKRYIYFKIIFI